MSFLLLLFPLVSAQTDPVLTPEQIHLSFGEDDFSMYVMWATLNQTLNPYVEYTLVGAGSQVVTVPAETRIYANVVYDWESAPLIAYWAEMTGLELGQYYRYRVGSSMGMSDYFTFRSKRDFTTGPPAKMIWLGDWGTGPEMDPTLDKLIFETQGYQYDALMHMGDFAYELNSRNGTNGNDFMNAIQPIAAHLPYMGCQGNHEGPEHYCTEQWVNRFKFPNNSSNFYYSFDLGFMHIAAVSTELAYELDPKNDDQMKWLENDLASVDRNKTPWVIVTGHRPTYCSANMTTDPYSIEAIPWDRHNTDCLHSAPIMREQFESLFYQYKVDIELYGHVHSYERMNPVYNNQSQPAAYIGDHEVQGATAPVVIISGMPGQGESYAPPSPTPLPWSANQDTQKGYGILTALSPDTIMWEEVASGNRTVLDYLVLRK